MKVNALGRVQRSENPNYILFPEQDGGGRNEQG
jgi:hypothetical protein